MIHVFYNPYSSNGKTKKIALRLVKKLKKSDATMIHRLRNLDDFKQYVERFSDIDRIYIVGGDGTIHYILNDLQTIDFKFKVFIYRSGSGNDFARDHKGKIFEITDEIKNLPFIEFIYLNSHAKKE